MDRQEWLRRQEEMAVIEARLTKELAKARERYNRVKTTQADLANGKLTSDLGNTADGAFSHVKAIREFNYSLRRYQEALSRFCEFILRGEIPPDQEAEPHNSRPDR
jgi:hypothetical protein